MNITLKVIVFTVLISLVGFLMELWSVPHFIAVIAGFIIGGIFVMSSVENNV